MTITRRQWLAVMPASLTLAQTPASPTLAQAPASFERIDTHVHVNRPSSAILAGLQSSNWRVLSICVSRATGNDPTDLQAQVRGTARLSHESGGRVAWAGSFDARHWQDPDFASSTITALEQQFRDGAIAVKIWKNIGMSLRTKEGRYVLPDDAAFQPIYAMLQKEGHTLIAHLAEPNGAWMPLDEHNPERGFYSTHPEWHMYGHSDAPAKEDILNARDRIVAKYPKLRVVGCHLGSNEDELETLAARLDRYSNFAVDLAARVRYLAAGDREKSRAFVMHYQDRLTYGTDFTLGAQADEEKAWSSLANQHDRDWQYFSSAEKMTYGRGDTRGLGLPENVLRKIFRENAVRVFPGIA